MKRLKGPELKMPELKVPPLPRRPLLRPARPAPAAAGRAGRRRDRRRAVPARRRVRGRAPPAAAGRCDALAGARRRRLRSSPSSRPSRACATTASGLPPHADRSFKQRYTGPVLKGAQLNPRGDSRVDLQLDRTTSTRPDHRGDIRTATAPSGRSRRHRRRRRRRTVATGGELDRLRLRDRRQDRPHPETRTPTASTGRRRRSCARALPPTPLPGEKTPVVTYMGAQPEGQGAAAGLRPTSSRSSAKRKCLSGDGHLPAARSRAGLPGHLRLRRQRRPLHGQRAEDRAGRHRADT